MVLLLRFLSVVRDDGLQVNNLGDHHHISISIVLLPRHGDLHISFTVLDQLAGQV
jgi:hypothetical protein